VKIFVSKDVTSFSHADHYQRFGEICCFHLQVNPHDTVSSSNGLLDCVVSRQKTESFIVSAREPQISDFITVSIRVRHWPGPRVSVSVCKNGRTYYGPPASFRVRPLGDSNYTYPCKYLPATWYISTTLSILQFYYTFPYLRPIVVKVTLQLTTSLSVSPGFNAHEGLTTGYLFLLTFTSIVLSITGAPSDERSGPPFVMVIVRPLLVNIYRFTCNVHVSYKYTYI
jgi:hypothetical protein